MGLLVKLAHTGVDDFVARYATNLSEGGMFIRTREPKPVGTELAFKVELAQGQRVLQGFALVKWVRGVGDAGGPPGMGIEFLELDPASQALVDRMLGSVGSKAPSPPTVVALPSIAPLVPPVQPSSDVPAMIARSAAPPEVKAQAMPPPPPPDPEEIDVDLDLLLSTTPPPPPGLEFELDFGDGGDDEVGVPIELEPELEEAGGRAAFAGAPGAGSASSGAARAAPGGASISDSIGEALAGGAVDTGPSINDAIGEVLAGATIDEAEALSLSDSLGDALAGATVDGGGLGVAPRGAGAAPGSRTGSGGASGPARVPAASAAGVSGAASSGAASRGASASGASASGAVSTGAASSGAASGDTASSGGGASARGAPPSGGPARARGVRPPPGAPPIDIDAALAALPEVRRGPGAARAPQVMVTLQQAQPTARTRLPTASTPVYLSPPGELESTGPVIGIDLGTTNSCCSVLSNGKPFILTSKDGYSTIPSVVALTAGKKLFVGHRARSQQVLNPSQSISGAKRLVGRPYDSPIVKQLKERAHYQIVAGHDGRAAVKLGDDVLALEEIQGIILRECKEMAQQHLGVPVQRAVVTCPAYYSEPQREAVRRAGAMAGLKVERVLNEPTAAALAYGMNRQLAKTVLVFDLGGGTFDATVLRIDKNVFEVLATGGDVFLGGVDFDNQIVDVLLEKFQATTKVTFNGDAVALSRLAEVAERAKIALSERSTFDVELPMLQMGADGKSLDLRCTLARDEVAGICRELVDRTIDQVRDVLLDAKLKAQDIDDIILVGGMSRMPSVRERIKEVFKKTPQASVNADEAVALGAALYSGSVDKVSSVVLIDVVPMTIGLGLPGGSFKRIIERNSPLPVTSSFSLSTQEDNQTLLEVLVFQGEDPQASANEFLGAVQLSGLPKGPKGMVKVVVQLSLDAECVLKVEARELLTRRTVSAVLATRYTDDEVIARLGIPAAQQAQEQQRRAQELDRRAGGFWAKLKKVFGRA